MPDPLVSVIVPTYNRPELLARALQSIADQTWQDYEILVVNDGGENTSKVAAKHPRTRYLQHECNRGLPVARNTALKAARGKYIAYLDDDDIYYSNHLETLVGVLRGSGRRLAYTDCHYWYNETWRKVELSIDYDRELLLKHNLTPIICVMHERNLIDEAGLFDEDLPNHEDYDLWLRFSEVTDFYHSPVVTCAYSKRNNGKQMSSNSHYMAECLASVQRRYRDRLRQIAMS